MNNLHPMEVKKRYAKFLTARYHGENAASDALAYFEKTVSRGEAPDEVPEHRASRPSLRITDLLVEAGLAPSKNEARLVLERYDRTDNTIPLHAAIIHHAAANTATK